MKSHPPVPIPKTQLKLLKLLRKIPKGRVSTYKLIGQAAGVGPRPAGYYLKTNPRSDLYPCYKVVKSDGQIGGYSGADPKNIAKKIRLLKKDGIEVKNGKIINFEKHLWHFKDSSKSRR